MTTEPYGPYEFVVDHVRDGDTIYGVVQVVVGATERLPFNLQPITVPEWWGVRFYGINAPELYLKGGGHNPDGFAARDYLMSLVAPGDKLWVLDRDWDKYSQRIDCEVRIGESWDTGEDLGKMMVESGHAVYEEY